LFITALAFPDFQKLPILSVPIPIDERRPSSCSLEVLAASIPISIQVFSLHDIQNADARNTRAQRSPFGGSQRQCRADLEDLSDAVETCNLDGE
jgi:hypothetical protein